MTSSPLTTFVTLLTKEVEKTADTAPPADRKDERKSPEERKSQDVPVDPNQCP